MLISISLIAYILSTCPLIHSLTLEKPKSQYYSFTNRFGEHKIRYTTADLTEQKTTTGPPVLFIHGFGGNADQFRYNIPAVAKAGYKTFAIDLLGYGFSDKPNPKAYGVNEVYNFENWAEQVAYFIDEVVKEPCVLVCNSVGGCVGLQAGITRPDVVKGIVLMNISLRLLHKKKQNPMMRPFVASLQYILRESGIGNTFFNQVATPRTLKAILSSAYASETDVTDEIVDIILQPGLDPRAVNVFLDFISYSGGPLPEEQLEQLSAAMKVCVFMYVCMYV